MTGPRKTLYPLLAALVFLGACYFCPFGEFDLASQQFYSWKLGKEIPAKEWTPVGMYVVQQPTMIQNAHLSVNAEMLANKVNTRIKARALVHNAEGVKLDTLSFNLKFKRGKIVDVPVVHVPERFYNPGDRISVEAWSAKPLPKDLWFAAQLSHQQEPEPTNASVIE